jgi:hypothetical protein
MAAADGAPGRATITLLVNTPPFCPGTSCFSLDSTTSTFPAFTFTGSVSGWADAEGDDLSYEYGVVSSLGPAPLLMHARVTYDYTDGIVEPRAHVGCCNRYGTDPRGVEHVPLTPYV